MTHTQQEALPGGTFGVIMSGSNSGLPAGCLRYSSSENSIYPGWLPVAVSILQTTGMRYSELVRLRLSMIQPAGVVEIPPVKRGHIKFFPLTLYQIAFILDLGLEYPFKEYPTYQQCRRFIIDRGLNNSIERTLKKQPALSALRKLKVRELMACGETLARLASVFGWKKKESVVYYLP